MEHVTSHHPVKVAVRRVSDHALQAAGVVCPAYLCGGHAFRCVLDIVNRGSICQGDSIQLVSTGVAVVLQSRCTHSKPYRYPHTADDESIVGAVFSPRVVGDAILARYPLEGQDVGNSV